VRPLVVAILAKSVEHVLPYYLQCIARQTVLNEHTILYVRTNDNNDRTADILRDWIERRSGRIVFDDSGVDASIAALGNHEWSQNRFRVLGAIRQASVEFALAEGADYFVADTDNMIRPTTIASLRATGLPVVAPMLRNISADSAYSNYHYAIDSNGYYASHPLYWDVLEKRVRGCIEVPVVHCTYFIRHEALRHVRYQDETTRHEYVIFSESLRKAGVPQYIDNRNDYGFLSFHSNAEEMFQYIDRYEGVAHG